MLNQCNSLGIIDAKQKHSWCKKSEAKSEALGGLNSCNQLKCVISGGGLHQISHILVECMN